MAKKSVYKAIVIEAFKKYNKRGLLKSYNIGDTFISNNLETIEYLKQIKKIK